MADFLPFLYGFGLAACLSNRDFKRLGDMAAGTLVIYLPEREHIYNIPARKPLALPSPLKLPEQRAILDFAERADRLSIERRRELALILNEYSNTSADEKPNLTGDDVSAFSHSARPHHSDPVEPLLRYANWMIHGNQERKDETP